MALFDDIDALLYFKFLNDQYLPASINIEREPNRWFCFIYCANRLAAMERVFFRDKMNLKTSENSWDIEQEFEAKDLKLKNLRYGR
jgi:hypothetical protein